MSSLPHFKTILKKILAEKKFFLDKTGQIRSQNGHFAVARLVTTIDSDGSLNRMINLILNYRCFVWKTSDNDSSPIYRGFSGMGRQNFVTRNQAVRDFDLLIEESTQKLIESILELVDLYNQNPDRVNSYWDWNNQAEVGEAQ